MFAHLSFSMILGALSWAEHHLLIRNLRDLLQGGIRMCLRRGLAGSTDNKGSATHEYFAVARRTLRVANAFVPLAFPTIES